ncbi:MAG: hypothetical protein AB7V77_01105 [Candidatus Woesearchaeota archaeon]
MSLENKVSKHKYDKLFNKQFKYYAFFKKEIDELFAKTGKYSLIKAKAKNLNDYFETQGVGNITPFLLKSINYVPTMDLKIEILKILSNYSGIEERKLILNSLKQNYDAGEINNIRNFMNIFKEKEILNTFKSYTKKYKKPIEFLVDEALKLDKKTIIEISKTLNQTQIMDLLNKYNTSKLNHENITNIIFNMIKLRKDKEIIIETTNLLDQYVNNYSFHYISKFLNINLEIPNYAELLTNYSNLLKDKEIMEILNNCHEKYDFKESLILKSVILIASYTLNKDAVLATNRTLKKCYDKEDDVFRFIVDKFINIAEMSEDKNKIKKLAKIYEQDLDYNLSKSKEFLEIVLYVQDDELISNLSKKEYSNISKAYQIVQGMISSKPNNIKNKTTNGFFESLNQKILTGKNIPEKLKIINSWSNKIYNSILQNPDGYAYVVAK